MSESKSILYIGTLITDQMEEDYNLSYSYAGNSKRENIVKSLARENDVDVLSPMFLSRSSYSIHRAREYTHSETGVDIKTSQTVDIPYLNFFVLAITTTISALLMVFRNRYDAVVFYNFSWKAVLPAYFIELTYGIPIVIEYEDGLIHHEHFVMRFVATVTSKFDGIIDGGICVNETLANRLTTENTTIVYGRPSVGMPDELPTPSKKRSETAIMFAGAFDQVRGSSEFIRLADMIAEDRSDVSFWMSGYGSEEEIARVRSEIDACSHADIEFFGTLPWDDYREKLVSADILINPQDPSTNFTRYSFPSKLLDFMATGNYVISTDIDGIDSHFNDKIVVDGESVESLKEGVLMIIDEPQAVEASPVASREWIESECTIEAISNRIEDVLSDV